MKRDSLEMRGESGKESDFQEPSSDESVLSPPPQPGTEAPVPTGLKKDKGREKSEETHSDHDLLDYRRAAEGDTEAFERLVLRHQDKVYSRIYFMVRHRETASDLAQEAFFKAWKGLPKFRGESLFSTWLARIAVNVTHHYFEKQRAQKRAGKEVSIDAPLRALDGDATFEISDSTHLPEEWAMRNERQQQILEAVASLEPEFREALALRELHQLSYQEIAEELDLAVGTVKSKIFRARKALQEKLKGIL